MDLTSPCHFPLGITPELLHINIKNKGLTDPAGKHDLPAEFEQLYILM